MQLFVPPDRQNSVRAALKDLIYVPFKFEFSIDPDGDGWSNWQEYQNGTNPNNADQPFIIIVTQPSANSIIP